MRTVLNSWLRRLTRQAGESKEDIPRMADGKYMTERFNHFLRNQVGSSWCFCSWGLISIFC